VNRTGLVLMGAVVTILGWAVVYNGAQSLAAGTTAAGAFPFGDPPGSMGFIASLVPGATSTRKIHAGSRPGTGGKKRQHGPAPGHPHHRRRRHPREVTV